MNLTQIMITASDENSVQDTLNTWKSYTTNSINFISKINTHGYKDNGHQPRVELYNEVVVKGQKILWNSEYGDGDGTGGQMARNIFADFANLHPSAWCYW